jgi:hypothetical protein
MKLAALAFLSALLPLALLQEDQKELPPPKIKDPVARFFQGEGPRLEAAVQGAWILMDFVDPQQRDIAEAVSGFAQFQDGFLTLIIGIQTFDTGFFGVDEELLLQTGAYRYRFDELANLQLSTVLGYTSFNDDAQLERELQGDVYEYIVTVDDGVLDLRTNDGIVITFRRTTAGEFPDSAIRTLERRRSGQPFWEDPTGAPR